MAKRQGKSKRYRNFTFIWYPRLLTQADDAGEWFDWYDIEPLHSFLTGLHVKGYYVLHDLDEVTDNGDNGDCDNDDIVFDESGQALKKAHCHVVLMFDSVKDLESVLEILEPLGVKYAEPVQSIKPMLRYLIHADDVHKHQYNECDVMAFGGARSYAEVIALSDEDSSVKLLMSVFAYIRESGIVSFARLVDSLALESRLPELKVVLAQSYAVLAYLKSVAWERECNQ